MFKSFLILSVLAIFVLSKESARKFKLRFKKKAEEWFPTNLKRGNPKDKTGDEWCKSELDGGAM